MVYREHKTNKKRDNKRDGVEAAEEEEEDEGEIQDINTYTNTNLIPLLGDSAQLAIQLHIKH